MSVHPLVEQYYAGIWNAGGENVGSILTDDFSFRGSLGAVARGHAEFLNYARTVRQSLGNYRCEILDCVTEIPRSFARMHFSGVHVGPFRDFAPTGKPVYWHGAALFTFRGNYICELWVLGDLAALDERLRGNAVT